jgi:hypothetical protein
MIDDVLALRCSCKYVVFAPIFETICRLLNQETTGVEPNHDESDGPAESRSQYRMRRTRHLGHGDSLPGPWIISQWYTADRRQTDMFCRIGSDCQCQLPSCRNVNTPHLETSSSGKPLEIHRIPLCQSSHYWERNRASKMVVPESYLALCAAGKSEFRRTVK